MNRLVYDLGKRHNAPVRKTGTWTAKTWLASTVVAVERNACRLAVAGERLLARQVSSDVALAIRIPGAGFAALVRFSLPEIKPNVESSESLANPWIHAESAIPLLIDTLRSLSLQFSKLSAYAVGGANESVNVAEPYTRSLGHRNQLALRRILWREGILLRGQDLGGSCSKSLWLETATGRAIVRTDSGQVNEPRGSSGLEQSKISVDRYPSG